MFSHLFRRYQQAFTLFFAMITIISFIGFYSKSDFLDRGVASHDAVIYGRNIPLLQAQHGARKADLCLQLAQMEVYGPREQQGLMNLYESLAVNRQDAKENFIWNSMRS